jgi:hypothetical protein
MGVLVGVVASGPALVAGRRPPSSTPRPGTVTSAGGARANAAALGSAVHDGDLATVSAQCDHLAVQHYGVTAMDPSGRTVNLYPTSDASWEQVHPEGLYETLTRQRDEYPLRSRES